MLTYIIIGLIVYSLISRVIKQATGQIKKDYEEYYEREYTPSLEEIILQQKSAEQPIDESQAAESESTEKKAINRENKIQPISEPSETTGSGIKESSTDSSYQLIHEYQEDLHDIHLEEKKEIKTVELMFDEDDLKRGMLMKEIIDTPLFLRIHFKKS